MRCVAQSTEVSLALLRLESNFIRIVNLILPPSSSSLSDGTVNSVYPHPHPHPLQQPQKQNSNNCHQANHTCTTMMSDAFTQQRPAATLGQGCSNNEPRTLRRRRSAASAALLFRPSMLTLGDLAPSFETCVLIYASSSPTIPPSGSKLIYALFEPNFLVDGANQTVRKLDRASWERLRSHVEELRIVALSDSPSSENRRDCVFDLCTPTDDLLQRTVSRMYLQPNSYAAVPARGRDELLKIEIYAPSDAAEAERRRACLPTQVKAVLSDAEQLICNNAGLPTPLSAPPHAEERRTECGKSQSNFASTCTRILELVREA